MQPDSSYRLMDDGPKNRRTRFDSRAPKPKVPLPEWIFFLNLLMETYTVVSFAWRIAVGGHTSFIIAIAMTAPRVIIWYYTTFLLCNGSHRDVWSIFCRADDIFLAASFAVVPYWYVQYIYPDNLAMWAAAAFTVMIMFMNAVVRAHVQRYDFPRQHFLVYKTCRWIGAVGFAVFAAYAATAYKGVNSTEVYVYLIFVSNTTLWLKALFNHMGPVQARKDDEAEDAAEAAEQIATENNQIAMKPMDPNRGNFHIV